MESPDLEVLTDDDLARRQRARHELMGPAVRALLELSQRGELTTAHVELSAHTLGVHVRTVWRNLARARLGEPLRRGRGRFGFTDASARCSPTTEATSRPSTENSPRTPRRPAPPRWACPHCTAPSNAT